MKKLKLCDKYSIILYDKLTERKTAVGKGSLHIFCEKCCRPIIFNATLMFYYYMHLIRFTISVNSKYVQQMVRIVIVLFL